MIKKAILKSFHSVTYTAAVQLQGSLSTWLSGVPVSRGIPSGEMIVGRTVVVLLLDETNPGDAVIISVHTP